MIPSTSTPTTSGVLRTYDADRIIDSWTRNQNNGLTPAGANWFRNAINPFRDSDSSNLNGWPDANRDPSIVQMIPTTVTVSAATFSTIATGTWDLQAIMTQFPAPVKLVDEDFRLNNVGSIVSLDSGSYTIQYGGVTLLARDTGGTFFQSYLNLPMPTDDSVAGLGRLVGMGLEIRDVSPEIYKQGTLTAYRMPNTSRCLGTWSITSNGAVVPPQLFNFDAYGLRLFPLSVGEALKYRGSKQWEVRHGMYQVAKFCGSDNPPTNPLYSGVVLFRSDDLDSGLNSQTLSAGTSPLVEIPSANANNTKINLFATQAKRIFPIHTSGAILSGLSTQYSNITITVRWIFESFPSVDESTLLNIARPSTGYDPVAMELYSHGMQFLPVAVQVAENDTGEWFWDVVNKVASVAKPILGMIPHPIAQAGALLADKAKSVSAKQLGQQPKKKKQKQPLIAPGK